MLYYLLLFRQRDRARNNRGGTGGVLFFTPSYNNTHAPAGLWGASWGGGVSASCNTHVQTLNHNKHTDAHTHKGTFTPIRAHKGQVLVSSGCSVRRGSLRSVFHFLSLSWEAAAHWIPVGRKTSDAWRLTYWKSVFFSVACDMNRYHTCSMSTGTAATYTQYISLLCVCVCVCEREMERERERVCLHTLFMFVGKTPTMKRE